MLPSIHELDIVTAKQYHEYLKYNCQNEYNMPYNPEYFLLWSNLVATHCSISLIQKTLPIV